MQIRTARISQAEFAQTRARLAELFKDKFQLSLDEAPLPPSEPKLVLDNKNNNVDVRIKFERPAGSMLAVKCGYLDSLPSGHREYFVLQSSVGKPIIERLLDKKDNTVTFELALMAEATRADAPGSFGGFLWLGIEHILTGYDHLLFLFALLLVSGNFMSSLKIITCFTIAHSVTLALATLNVVQLSSRVVEPMIAASIVYVGVENLTSKGAPKGRWMLTFAFGLVHGFGFASVLRELGIASGDGGVAVPLFSFNLGVEVGQVAIAAIILPIVWRLRKQPLFVRRWIPACSALVALAGAFWFVQRVAGF
jgi:hydrogenase/urease accessory protein HupE